MEKAPSPELQFSYFRLLFSIMKDIEVIKAFNNQVGNLGWTSSRASYLAALHLEFDERGWNYSEIGDARGLSYRNEVYLVGKKISVL